MKRIILHWTAGTYAPSSFEKEHYHFLVDGLGKIHEGKHKPEDNLNCNDGKYAEHCGGGNTGSIGISLCAMAGFKNKNELGKYPITKLQFESAMKLCAELAKKYNIAVTPETVMTHYEFGKANPKTTSNGKIDIIYLPPCPHVLKDDVGSFIRSKIRWYLDKL